MNELINDAQRTSYALKYRNKYVNKLKVKNVSKQQNTVKVKNV
jgi:hypothetical protein